MRFLNLTGKLIPIAVVFALLGTVAAAQPVYMPHVVFGTVSGPDGGPEAGATVKITNLRTQEYITGTTDGEGRYQIDLSGLPSGYMVGDEIEATATIGELSGSTTIMVSSGPNDQCNVVVEEDAGTPHPGILPIIAIISCAAVVAGLFRRRL